MKKLLGLIAAIAILEIWILQPKSKIQQWQDLKKADSSIAITPQILILRRNFQEIEDRQGVATIPLGSRAKSEILLCEESEDMIHYQSDRYGFRNQDSVWDRPIDLALVGDSFAQGACVPEGSDFGGQLKKNFGNILNMGSLGNGPIANLAVISEYLKDLKPKRLIWFYVANDLSIDLPVEEQTTLLDAYKDPSFSQGLKFRQADLNDLIDKFLSEEKQHEEQLSPWKDWIKLSNTQNALTRWTVKLLRFDANRQALDMDYARPDTFDLNTLTEVLALAKARLPETHIDFVVIPDAGMYSASQQDKAKLHVENLRTALRGLPVSFIDLSPALAEKGKPLSYYSVKEDGTYGHFTSEGYRIVSSYLARKLQDDPM